MRSEFFWPPLVIASACGELGRKAEAASAVNALLAMDRSVCCPCAPVHPTCHHASGFLEPLLEGLRKAGLEIPELTKSS